MLYILVLVFFSFFVGELIRSVPSRLFAYFCNLCFLFIVLNFTLGITYTTDWYMYYYMFKFEVDKTDPVFYNLSVLFNNYNLPYAYLFYFHISCTVLLYFFLITRFTRNYFFVFSLYLILDYVHLTNQIRYYMGIPIIFLGFYYLLVRKKYIVSIGLIIFSLLCHSALSVLLIFIPIYYFVPYRRYIKVCLYIAIVAFCIVYIIFNTGIGTTIKHFGFYLESENGSSVMGGLFNAIPYLLIISFLYFFSSKYLKGSKKIEDPKFIFLYKATFFSIVLIPGAFLIQIIGHRYIMPFGVFWLMYYLYLIKGLPIRKNIINYLLFATVIIVVVYSIYILPDYVLKENHFFNELKYILNSINHLKGVLYDEL